MLSLTDIGLTYTYDFCKQCGSCLAACPCGAITAHMRQDCTHDFIIDYNKCILCKKCVAVCPSANPSDNNKREDYIDKKYYLGSSKNPQICKDSSSGGVAKTILVEGLKHRLFDGAYSLIKIDDFPLAEGHFYRSDDEISYSDIPNSVYHSLLFNTNLSEIEYCNNLLLVGTSCQLKGAKKLLKGKYGNLYEVCIFCKQQKTLNSTRFIAKMTGQKIPNSLKFEIKYRGDGWPGRVCVTSEKTVSISWDRAAALPFGRRLWCVSGCRVCGTPFGENVDLSLMDPWSIENQSDQGNTLIVVHSDKGEQLLRSIAEIDLKPTKYSDVLPALGFDDIERKQKLIPYFRKESTSFKTKIAGRMERLQRITFECLLSGLPRLPMILYRIFAHLPDWRNLILRK